MLGNDTGGFEIPDYKMIKGELKYVTAMMFQTFGDYLMSGWDYIF